MRTSNKDLIRTLFSLLNLYGSCVESISYLTKEFGQVRSSAYISSPYPPGTDDEKFNTLLPVAREKNSQIELAGDENMPLADFDVRDSKQHMTVAVF